MIMRMLRLIGFCLLASCNTPTFSLRPPGPGQTFIDSTTVWKIGGFQKFFPELPDEIYFRAHVPPDYVDSKVAFAIDVTPFRTAEYLEDFNAQSSTPVKAENLDPVLFAVQVPRSSGLVVGSTRKSQSNLYEILLEPAPSAETFEKIMNLGKFGKHKFVPAPIEFAHKPGINLESVAMMFKIQGSLKVDKEKSEAILTLERSFCSAFLVGESLILTNSHCVPSKDECRSTIFRFTKEEFVKPGRDATTEHRDYLCKKLHSVSRELDYALVEVFGNPGVNYPVIPLDASANHFETDTGLAKMVFNPSRSPNKQSHSCKVTDTLNTCFALNPDFDINQQCATHYAVRAECEIPTVSGDSGGAIVSAAGKVVGLNWGSQTTLPVDPVEKTSNSRFQPEFKSNLETTYYTLFTPLWAVMKHIRANAKPAVVKALKTE